MGPQPQPYSQGIGRETQSQKMDAADRQQKTEKKQWKHIPAAKQQQEEAKQGAQRVLFKGESSGLEKGEIKNVKEEDQGVDFEKKREKGKQVEEQNNGRGYKQEIKTKKEGVGRGSYYGVLETNVDGDGDLYDTSHFKTDWDPGDCGK